MNEQTAALPAHITPPLRWAASATFVMLMLISIWAFFVPLATTIKANGNLISAQPNYEIQHPYGGQIKLVNIVQQQNVKRGETLLILETETQNRTLRQIKNSCQRYRLKTRLFRESWA